MRCRRGGGERDDDAALAAGFFRHPVAQFGDEAGLLGQRYEVGRQRQAALRVAPAQLRFDAEQRVAADGHARLVMEFQLAVAGGLAQFRFERAPLRRGGAAAGRQKRKVPRPAALAAYMAASALRIRPNTSLPSPGKQAMPIEAPVRSVWPPHSTGCASAAAALRARLA